MAYRITIAIEQKGFVGSDAALLFASTDTVQRIEDLQALLVATAGSIAAGEIALEDEEE